MKTLTRSQANRATVIEDKDGKLLTEKTAVLNRWTEYCRELYNFESKPDPNVLDDDPREREPETLPVIREEVEEAI